MQTRCSKVIVQCAERFAPPQLLSLPWMNRWKRGIAVLIEDAVTKLQVYHMGAFGVFIRKLLMQFYFLDYE